MTLPFADKVRRAFTEAAEEYDALAHLQQDIGQALLAKAAAVRAGRVLDIGCGTGDLLAQARDMFQAREAIGLDVAEGMLARARRKNSDSSLMWVQADAQALPFDDGTVDCAVSNLAYQWVEDYALAFREVHRVLTSGAGFYATLFGAGTCAELFEAFNAVSPATTFRRLPAVDDIKAALLRSGFTRISVTHDIKKIPFADVRALIQWLKGTGANNLGPKDFFMGKELLARVDEYYRQHHATQDGVYASFDVIWADGRK